MHNSDRPFAQNIAGASSGTHMPVGSSLAESLRQMQHEVSALKALGVALPASSATTQATDTASSIARADMGDG